ncbi:MAG: alpha/beta hydrolase, partial [Verrucomicrobiota bacterium]
INHFHMMTSQDFDGAIELIRSLGFNAGCYQGPRWMWSRHPYTKGITLVPTSAYKSDEQFGFRDVFDPEFLTSLDNMIRGIVEPQSENPFLIGYFWTDIGVWERERKGESWIGFFKSLPEDSPGGKVWREWKRENGGVDENRFLAVVAKQLYSQAHAMVRKYDTNHLILGDRWFEIDMPEYIVRESLPYVDAIAIQPTSREYNHEFFEGVVEKYGKPIYLADHVSSYATEEHPITMGQAAKTAQDYVEYYERYVTTALAQPYLIGYNKCQFQDELAPNGMLKQGIIRRDEEPYPVVDGIREANLRAIELAYSAESMVETEVEQHVVQVDEAINGSFSVSPSIPSDGRLEPGTILTLSAVPNQGYVLDSLYAAVTGHRGWTLYNESMASSWELEVDQDMRIGAAFIPQTEVEGFRVIHNIEYAQPGVKQLRYDAFIPDRADALPGIVIIHGGGWSANTEDVMRGLARELVKSGDYVVFSIDYRWLFKLDGDEKPNAMADLIGDVFGAIAHIQHHASDYGLDPTRLAVTGDSAGGHLSASAANMADMIGDNGFGEIDGVYQYLPSYLPPGKSIEEVRSEMMSAIQVAAPSYGIFGGERLKAHGKGRPEGWLKALSPIDTIPAAEDRAVPQLLLRGTRDWIKHEDVQAYADALSAAGQRVEYVQPEGAGHAFLDWKPDPEVQETFAKYGVAGAETMLAFFDSVFYPQR